MDNGTIAVTFKRSHKGDDLIADLAHEGQHVFDADQFLASGALANAATDLNHRQRELHAYTVESMMGQALGRDTLPGATILIWQQSWRKKDQADIDSRRERAVSKFVSTTAGYPEDRPGLKYSQEFHPRR